MSDTLSGQRRQISCCDPMPNGSTGAKGKAAPKTRRWRRSVNDQCAAIYGQARPQLILLRLARTTQAPICGGIFSELAYHREGECCHGCPRARQPRTSRDPGPEPAKPSTMHLEQIYSKLGVENRTAAAAIAVNKKVVRGGEPPPSLRANGRANARPRQAPRSLIHRPRRRTNGCFVRCLLRNDAEEPVRRYPPPAPSLSRFRDVRRSRLLRQSRGCSFGRRGI